MDSGFGHSIALARVQSLAQLAPLAPAAPAATQQPGGVGGSGTFGAALQDALGQGAAGTPTTGTGVLQLPPPSSIPPGWALVPIPGYGGVQAVSGGTGVPSVVGPPSQAAFQRVAAAAAELGVQEDPPGSNDSARISTYRTATQGAGVGPWCAYFVSWVSAQAGTPLGPNGRGEGYCPYMKDWLVSQGRWAGPEQTPRPGDLVLFDRTGDGVLDHIGLVESVDASGRIHTIEGNSSNSVRRRDYDRSQIAGYGLLP